MKNFEKISKMNLADLDRPEEILEEESVQDADQIIIMNNGSVEAIGTHDELLASNPIYQEVYYSQNKGGEQDEK